MTSHPSAIAELIVVSGPDVGRTWPLGDGATHRIGRGKDCEVQLADQSVSRLHCEIVVTRGELTLVDAGSKWGTRVNGRRVDREALRHNAVIELGDTQLKVNADAQPLSTLPPRRAVAPKSPPEPEFPLTVVYQPPARDEPGPKTVPSAAKLDLNSLPGKKFVHFQVETLVSRGANGIVFKAVDTRSNRPVALKIFWPAIFEDEKVSARFLRSMQAMLPLEHENLVKVHAAGRSQGHCFTASEFVAGESAAQLIARVGIAGMLDWRTVWKIGLGLARALEYIHGKNVLHRNLRPNNILIRKSDECVKLGDTMLAKSLDELGQAVVTQRGEVVGDMHYLSPEQVMGGAGVDQRTDLYSLGASLYALLTGKPPFLGGPADVINKILNVPPEPPTKTHLTIPASFEGIVLRLLAKHADGRYSNATLVVKELERTGRHAGLMK